MNQLNRRGFLGAFLGVVPVAAYPAVLWGQEPHCALHVRLYSYALESFFVIEIPEDVEPADRIIVTTMYLQHTQSYGTLHLTKTEVVPFIPGMSMGGGPIPASLKDIVRVEMEVVRRVCRTVEKFKREG